MNTRVRLADWAMTTECLGTGSIPLTVDLVSLLLGVRQACAVGRADLGIVALAHAGALEFDPVRAVNDAVQDRVADCVVADHLGMPQRLTGESLRCGWLIRTIPFMASAFRSAVDARAGDRG